MTSTPKTLIIGNWKMNLNVHEASLYAHHLSEAIVVRNDVEVVLAPPSLTLQSLSLQVKRRQFKLAAQNVYWRDEGAFTGEISASMLRGVAEYVIVGHSERRHIFGETNKDVRAKLQAVLRNGLTPILCVGETADERIAGERSARTKSLRNLNNGISIHRRTKNDPRNGGKFFARCLHFRSRAQSHGDRYGLRHRTVAAHLHGIVLSSDHHS